MKLFKKKYLLPALFCMLFSGIWLAYLLGPAAHHKEAGHGTLDPMAHVADHYNLHLIGGLHLYLPVILYHPKQGLVWFSSSRLHNAQGEPEGAYKGFYIDKNQIKHRSGKPVYDLSIKESVLGVCLIGFFLICLIGGMGYLLRRRLAAKGGLPQGAVVLFIWYVRFVRGIAREAIGESRFRRYVPFLLTLFSFILAGNFLGLLPIAANTTGNLSVTLGLACVVFVVINFWASHRAYWKHLFVPAEIPFAMRPIFTAIELLGLFQKPFNLGLRLFCNIMVGHVMLYIIHQMGNILGNLAVGFLISCVLGTFVTCLELIVSFVQAYVFTLLAALYIGAVEKTHDAH